MNDTLLIIRAMLAAGRINEKDRWHADDLVNRTPESAITEGQVRWLTSLALREGKPFQP